jgi:hypothetical protein
MNFKLIEKLLENLTIVLFWNFSILENFVLLIFNL